MKVSCRLLRKNKCCHFKTRNVFLKKKDRRRYREIAYLSMVYESMVYESMVYESMVYESDLIRV